MLKLYIYTQSIGPATCFDLPGSSSGFAVISSGSVAIIIIIIIIAVVIVILVLVLKFGI